VFPTLITETPTSVRLMPIALAILGIRISSAQTSTRIIPFEKKRNPVPFNL